VSTLPGPDPLCQHCRQYKRTRPRGLCRRCHKDRKVRLLYPPVSPHGRRMPAFMDTIGPRPAAKSATSARPGSAEKMQVLQARIASGLNPWSAQDGPLDPEIDRLAPAVKRKKTVAPAAAVASAPPAAPPRRRPPRVWVQRRADAHCLYLQWYDPGTGKRCSRSAGTDNEAEAQEKAAALAARLGGTVNAGNRWRRPRPGWVALRRRGERYRLQVTTGARPAGRGLIHVIQSNDAPWLASVLARRFDHGWKKGGTLVLTGRDVDRVRAVGVWNRDEPARRLEELDGEWYTLAT